MSGAGKAVFLSYASQDAEAARRIADALREAGVEVWFDQNELRGGDAWDAKIRRQIKECALFVPLISANTQSRPEGYFRLEWKLAVDRSHLMADDMPFLFPIVVGEVTEAAARVPDRFREVQWTRLRLDETPSELAARVTRLLAGAPPAATAPGASAQSWPKALVGWWIRRRRQRPAWLRVAASVVALILALFYGLRPLWQPDHGSSTPASPAAGTATEADSSARQLVAKARHLFEDEDDSNRENLHLAEDLLEQAEKTAPFDGEVWAAHAQLSGLFILLGYDTSEERLAAVRRQAERALELAPNSVESQLANAWYLSSQGSTLAEAEQVLTALIKRDPNDWRPLRLMAEDEAWQGHINAAVRWFERAAAFPQGAAVALVDEATDLFIAGRIDQAEQAVDRSLAIRPLGRTLLLKVRGQVLWDGDLDGAKQTLARMPPSLLLSDRGAFNAFRVWLWRREPAKALEVLRGVSRDFLEDEQYTGPKAVLVAAAQQLAGHLDLARPEWELGLRQIDERLGSDPDQPRLLYQRALCLVELGRSAEAAAALRTFRQTGRSGFTMWPGGGIPGLLLKLGHTSEALKALEVGVNEGVPLFHSRAVLSLNPAFDALRNNPRFQAILARAPGPGRGPRGKDIFLSTRRRASLGRNKK